jgi:polyribonucleotide nucleotidyltransferase
MHKQLFETKIAGKDFVVEFNDLAEQASGSAMVRYGESVILVTAVMSKKAKEGTDFLPLSVEFEEKFYASGKILGSRYVRREGKPSEAAILAGRIVDRTIRPLFDQHVRNDIQVIVTALSVGEEDTDIMSVIGASLALGTSSIPWNGPASAVRISRNKTTKELVVNPTIADRAAQTFDFELTACGKDGKINMIELGGHEIQESEVNEALAKASQEIEALQVFQKSIISKIGKEKVVITKEPIPSELVSLFDSSILPKFGEYVFSNTPGDGKMSELHEIWTATAAEKYPDASPEKVAELFEEKVNAAIHKAAIEEGKRADGRGVDDIRPLFAQAGGISSIVHGSGIFYRGGTHILSMLTLGGPQDAMTIEGEDSGPGKRFMHHYNFPPFSTGETGRVGGLNRRMIGHGALAEKALEPIIPDQAVFPYTIRIVSEALSSNGSTSMGSVCGSTLALMDAGVPIKKPVAGIASGLMMDGDRYKVLTDIQGPEDHHGDMDFKVAGTKDGITAIQMDVKVSGVPLNILSEAFEKARIARLKILDVITAAIPEPRKEISPNAPKILTMKVKQDQIGLVIGTGGKTIKDIKERSGAEILIEDDGTVYITGKNGAADKAKEIIYNMTREYVRGDRFEGQVTKILDFGAFVKISDSAEGLVHISEIAPFRVDKVENYLKEGDKVPVVVKEVDEKKRINLSIKLANPDFFQEAKK